jgi:vacuolar protein sorting-associated protein 13A/C
MTGIVTQPLEGARNSGIEGFVLGIGKGLLGMVAKPVVGVVDFASNVSEGIKNTTTVFEEELDRQRLPRFIGKDGVLRVISD